MINFKKETLEILKDHNKSWEDVRFVQGEDFAVENPKEEILELMNFEYDNDYGSPKVAMDLVIVGDNWWLKRHEYYGSEWWEYKETPKKLPISKTITRLQITDEQVGWKTLHEVNEVENENI